jgi:hypothetical protein
MNKHLIFFDINEDESMLVLKTLWFLLEPTVERLSALAPLDSATTSSISVAGFANEFHIGSSGKNSAVALSETGSSTEINKMWNRYEQRQSLSAHEV